MSTHVITDPAATRTPIPAPLSPAWLTLSAALTEEAPIIADRDDLVVDIAPGAGHGAPACFLPPHASIEIDGTHLGAINPATADPADPADRARYATVWGLFTHECAHAQHSRWDPPATAPAGAVAAAMLLEESRIEAAHVRRRPDDRYWLRASARNLILADMPTTPGMTAPEAAQAAGLLLARTDAGILENDETSGLRRVIRDVLTADTLTTLRSTWLTAHTVADDDAEAMIELGRRWCAAVGTDPYTTPPDSSSGSGSTDSGARGTRSPLASEVRRTVDEVARHAASETPPADGAARAASAAAEQATATKSQQIGKAVFGDGDGGNGHARTGTTLLSGRRAPTPAERRAARTLARALNIAGTTERHATRTTSPVPPGRLRMRGALAADAQRAAGHMPTAEPFTRTTRKTAPAPPLRIGIACDTSESMGRYTADVASAAWSLAHATRHTTVPAKSATVIFNRRVLPITHPGTALDRVTDFTVSGSDENLPLAIHALDGALGLAHPGAARLLVIISDGKFHNYATAGGQHLIDRLRAAGCAVLWLTTGLDPRPLHGATVHHLTDPTTTAAIIGRAATTALKQATH